MPENESIQDRLKKFISEKGLTPRGFEAKTEQEEPLHNRCSHLS